jgi:hypothetical protein
VLVVDPAKKRNVIPAVGGTLKETVRPVVNVAVAVDAPVVFIARKVPALIVVEPVQLKVPFNRS